MRGDKGWPTWLTGSAQENFDSNSVTSVATINTYPSISHHFLLLLLLLPTILSIHAPQQSVSAPWHTPYCSASYLCGRQRVVRLPVRQVLHTHAAHFLHAPCQRHQALHLPLPLFLINTPPPPRWRQQLTRLKSVVACGGSSGTVCHSTHTYPYEPPSKKPSPLTLWMQRMFLGFF